MSKEKELIDSIRQDAIDFKHDKKYQDRYEEYENMKQTLSDNLYSKNSHFIYELIQNAEDNLYNKSITPTLKFIVSNQGILTQNNEIGFNESNIESICKFSTSSKKGQKELGYIGEKGLGFKSVFAITEKPLVHSNSYLFYFKTGEYTIPYWVSNKDLDQYPKEFSQKDTTNIYLPFKDDFQHRDDIANKIKDIEPIVLLFLSKLGCLQILENNQQIINVERVSSKSFENFDETLLVFNENEESYYTKKKIISRPKDLLEPKREKVDKREIVIAFPHLDNKLKEDRIFSFLPTEMKTGLPFLIQSDFILIGNRENIIQENNWNLWLLDEIVDFFSSEFHNLKLSNKLNYLKYLDAEKSTHPFINKYYKKILKNLKKENLFLTNKGDYVQSDRICILEDYDFMIEYLSAISYNNSKNKKFSYLDPSFYVPKHLIESWNIEVVDKETFLRIIGDRKDHYSVVFERNNSLFENLIKFIGNSYKVNKTLSELPIIPLDESDKIKFYNKNDLKGYQMFYNLDAEGVLNDVFDNMKVISKTYHKEIEKVPYYSSVFKIRQPDIVQILESIKSNKEIILNEDNNVKLLTYIKNNYLGKQKEDIIELVKKNYFFLTKNGQFLNQLKIKSFYRKDEYESQIYISAEYLENKNCIESIVNKYCDRKFSIDFDFISRNYLESDSKNSNLDLKTLKSEWRVFFEELQIDDNLKLLNETINMGAWGSVDYFRDSTSFRNIPFIATALFHNNYSEEYKDVNIEIDQLTHQDAIFLFQKINEIEDDVDYRYHRVRSYYRGFSYNYVDVPWIDVVKNDFPVYSNKIKYKIGDIFLKVDKKLSGFFPKLPDAYKKGINDNITKIFSISESPDIDDILDLIRNNRNLEFEAIKDLFKYLHYNFKDSTFSLDEIPIQNKSDKLKFESKEKLIWENGRSLNLFDLSSCYDSDYKQFFIKQVGIQEKPTLEQYIKYLSSDKKPSNYAQIFNQFIIYLEELIDNRAAPESIDDKIFHVNGNSFSSDEIIFNDENIESETILNLFSVQKKIFSPFENIVNFYEIKRLSEFDRDTHVSNVEQDDGIQTIYRKLLNFVWDYIYSISSKRFNDLKENEGFILNTNNVINGGVASLILKIDVNDQFIEIVEKVYLDDDSIYVSETVDRKKIPTELSKYIGELVGLEYEKIERFYDKVHKLEEYNDVSYYIEEDITAPVGEDSFDVVYRSLKQKEESNLNKSKRKKTNAPDTIEKTYKFGSEKVAGSNNNPNSNDEENVVGGTPSFDDRNFIEDQIDENETKNSNESEINLIKAIDNTGRSNPKKETLINPDIVTNIELYREKSQPQLDETINRSDQSPKKNYSSRKEKFGKDETREFLKKQYKGQCQICGFTFDKKENKGKYFQMFDWFSKKISQQETNFIEAGSSLCLCAKCHSVVKHGDFEMHFINELKEIEDLSSLDFADFTDLVQSSMSTDEIPDSFDFIELDMHKASIRLLNEHKQIFYTEEHFLRFFNLIITLNEHSSKVTI